MKFIGNIIAVVFMLVLPAAAWSQTHTYLSSSNDCISSISVCNTDTVFIDCCDDTCPSTIQVFYEFCLDNDMTPSQSFDLLSTYSLYSYDLYGPYILTCDSVNPNNLYTTVTSPADPLILTGLPAGGYILVINTPACNQQIISQMSGFTTGCVGCSRRHATDTDCYTPTMTGGTICVGAAATTHVTACSAGHGTVTVDFGDTTTVTDTVCFYIPFSASHSYSSPGVYTIVTTISIAGTPVRVDSSTVTVIDCDPCVHAALISGDVCIASPVHINAGCCKSGHGNVSTDFGDGTVIPGPIDYFTPYSATHTYAAPGFYTITLTVMDDFFTVVSVYTSTVHIITCTPEPPPCDDCIKSFDPEPGKKYLISIWVKEGSAPHTKTNYTEPSMSIKFPSVSTTIGPLLPSGLIIDGWQRIEEEFTVPAGASDIEIDLSCGTGDCYFDDIRVFPYDGSMTTYVYNPITLRLDAELDERNYATFYEYDQEGKLIRIKKETERGIMTIKENKTTVVKQ